MTYIPMKNVLEEKRQKQGISRYGLSKKAGMGSSAVYRIETGVTSKVHHLSALAIAAALACKVEDIFTPIIKGG
ncbi:MAG: helix-turn-helix transcriptional regulator [Oscillospiraceae bacterium]